MSNSADEGYISDFAFSNFYNFLPVPIVSGPLYFKHVTVDQNGNRFGSGAYPDHPIQFTIDITSTDGVGGTSALHVAVTSPYDNGVSIVPPVCTVGP